MSVRIEPIKPCIGAVVHADRRTDVRSGRAVHRTSIAGAEPAGIQRGEAA